MSEVSAKPLHVALVTETFQPDINGVATTLGYLVNAMIANGWQVEVIHPGKSRQPDPEPQGFEQVIVPGMPIPFYRQLTIGLPAGRCLRERWRRQRPDIVHIATEGPLGWSAQKVARGLGIPLSTSLHTNFHSYTRHYGLAWMRHPVMGYLRRFHNRAPLSFIPTREQKQQLEAQGFHTMTVLDRGVDARLFSRKRYSPELRREWGADEDDLVVCYVGRLAAEKNLPLFARSVRAMQEVQPKLKAVLVGDGPLRPSLERQYPDFVFVGSKRGEELAAHYASADVFLFPSLTETYGNVVMEAMASGLAVVAFDYAAAHELIEDGECGLLADCGDEGEFISQAAALAQDPSWARGMGVCAAEAIAHRSWDTVAKRFLDNLQALHEATKSRLHAWHQASESKGA